ncbi:CAAX protease self-immunity [Meinhardsimonia xiamenensis]|jgi:membrane protease YdiL (CAAX protease family)|uniref:CAAX protease self-immunity n=1 Tax=Meinhardsimonia xiamenensis TaxID=990712 RepID=A0A1G8YMD1_9RHOB|nr:CPBP family intramembrane glutamic endopeptidase [Meinhardsimonia xiamenensis]PRX37358.1 CAAX prenyl protease-like protein [Meinhardsimonia xiamenensis]SDK03931.1 CAAX protease self-immunity [Meinhardsimonia xiamenensis]
MIAAFLGIVAALSGLAFLMMRSIEGAQSPEGWPGLPVWLLAVWSPTIAAVLLSWRAGELGGLLSRAAEFRSVPAGVWLLVAAPVVMAVLQRAPAEAVGQAGLPGPALLLAMVGLNLFLGPLGEEFGWRGWLTPRLEAGMHWLVVAAVVAGVWFVWHMPLWAVDSPQRVISPVLFGMHVLAYAFLIAAAQRLSAGSLVPAIALHLAFNLAANLALFTLGPDPAEWFRRSLPFYATLASLAVAWALLADRS